MGNNLIKASRAFEIFIEEMGNMPKGGDETVKYNDLYIAIDKTWRRIREEEE